MAVPQHRRQSWKRPRSLIGIGLGTALLGAAIWSATEPVDAAKPVQIGVAAQTPVPAPAYAPAQAPAQTPAQTPADESVPSTTSDPMARPWSVMLIGDTLLTRPVPTGADPFRVQSPLLSTADIAIANLETAITTRGDRQVKEYTFRSRAELAPRLHDAGVDIVSLANNHSLDFGTVGLDDTISALIEAGVEPVGAGDNLAAAVEPVHRMVGTVRVAVFGASQVIPAPKWVATVNRAGVASAGKNVMDEATEQLLAAVQQSRATNDVVIVMMHWGVERDTCPTDVQIRTGALLRRAGATAVVGAHPHVLQPIVRDATGVVAYSIGNFIWDPRGGLSGDTGIIELDFTGTAFTGVQFHPHKLNGNGWGAAVRTEADRKRIDAQVHRRCKGADGSTW